MRRFFLLFLVLLLCGQARAADLTEESQKILLRERELLGVDELLGELPDAVQKLYREQDDLNVDFASGAREILFGALRESDSALMEALKSGGMLLAVSLLCAILGGLAQSPSETVLRVAGVIAVTLLCSTNFSSMVGLGTAAIEEVSVFSKLLLPVLAGATTASGAPATGSAIYLGTIFFADLLTSAMQKLFLPLCYVYLACACADNAMGNDLLKRFQGLIRSFVAGGIKVLLILFSGYLAITGVVSGSADSAAVKAAKLALSTFVPVVGSVIGDASETVLVSASILRSGVGVAGLLGVIAICLTPFMTLGIHYLTLKVFAALSGTLGGKSLTQMIDAAATCMGLILAMIGTMALLNLISCVCFMKAVSVH